MRSRIGARSAAALVCVLALASGAPSGAALSVTRSAGTLELGGKTCELIPPRASLSSHALPFGSAPCDGVRPGAVVSAPRGMCTLNFLFRGSDGHRYIATAGHCAIGDGVLNEDAGERTWAGGNGPLAHDRTGTRIGRFVYAILESPKDFALIRLDSGVSASAGLCHFGGPTATNNDRTAGPVLLHHFGNGLAIGSILPARTHLANTLEAPDHVFANGVAAPGDSGAPVISADGRAVGVLVTGGVHINGLIDHGVVGITRLAPQVQRAQQRLGITLTLLTASF